MITRESCHFGAHGTGPWVKRLVTDVTVDSDEAAAHRELEEEAGLRLPLQPLGTHVVLAAP